MKNLFFILFLVSFTNLTFAQKSKKAVLVIVDGIPSDVFEKVATPYSDSLAQKGKYARAFVGGEKGGKSQSPTISAVGYNSMLTGTWANKHNVWGNDITNPKYDYWSVFRIMREARPESKLAIFSTWEDNRTKLLGERLPQTNHLTLDFVFDGYENDTLAFPHDASRNYIHQIDEKVVASAVQTIEAEGPDLSWVYLEYTDDMGHAFGDSPEFYRAVALADAQIGKIWQAIRYRENHFAEEWLLIVTTDHGRDAQTGKNHGGQSDRERSTWILTNQHTVNQQLNNNLSIVDILPSTCQFLGITPPSSIKAQWDGVSFLK